MSGFGAAAPPAGSSVTAGARNGSSDSLEKIDMSLGEGSASGPALWGKEWRGAGGTKRQRGRAERTNGLCWAPVRAEPTEDVGGQRSRVGEKERLGLGSAS